MDHILFSTTENFSYGTSHFLQLFLKLDPDLHLKSSLLSLSLSTAQNMSKSE